MHANQVAKPNAKFTTRSNFFCQQGWRNIREILTCQIRTVSGELVNLSVHLELRLWVGPGVFFSSIFQTICLYLPLVAGKSQRKKIRWYLNRYYSMILIFFEKRKWLFTSSSGTGILAQEFKSKLGRSIMAQTQAWVPYT